MFNIRPSRGEELSMLDILLLVLFPKHYTDKDGSVTENVILAFIDRNLQFCNFVIWNNLSKKKKKKNFYNGERN